MKIVYILYALKNDSLCISSLAGQALLVHYATPELVELVGGAKWEGCTLMQGSHHIYFAFNLKQNVHIITHPYRFLKDSEIPAKIMCMDPMRFFHVWRPLGLSVFFLCEARGAEARGRWGVGPWVSHFWKKTDSPMGLHT